MDLPRISVERPITISMVMICAMLLGLGALYNLSVDLFPNIDFPLAFIETPYPGVDPAEMENIVTRKIEEEVNTVENIKRVTSYSFEGYSWIMIEFNWGTDIDLAAVDLREKVDIAKRKLPRDIEQVTVAKLDINAQPVLNVSVGGELDLKTLRRIADKEIKPAFERIGGVANVEVFGGLEREIRVKVNPDRLKAFKLTINDVIGAVTRDNQNTPVGNITEGNFKYLVRSEGEVKTPRDLGGIVVRNIDGRPVYLSELARIEDGYKEIESVSRLNGKSAVTLALKKEAGANPVDISDAVKKVLPKLEEEYKKKITLSIGNDSSEFIRDSIQMVKDNSMTGAVLAVIVLFLFLKSIRSTIIIGVGIPLAVITTFAMMMLKKGMTLNLMTLGGLALGIGMIVDNSVVVLENIYRLLVERGESDRREIAIQGANEMYLAIMASTLTTVVVFVPIAFVPGVVGEIFSNMSATIVFSLLASLVVAVTVVPLMCAYGLKIGKTPREPLMDLIKRFYKALLSWILAKAWRRWAYFFLMFVVFWKSFAFMPPLEFFPKMDRGSFVLKFEAPEGTSIEKTDVIAMAMEEKLKPVPEIEKIITNLKLGEGDITVVLLPKEKRTKTTNDVIRDLRPAIAEIPGYRTVAFNEPKMGGPEGGKAVQIEVSGDDFTVIESICQQITEKIKGVPGLKDLDSGVKAGRPEIKVEFDRARLGDLKLELGTVAEMVRSYVYGTLAGQYKEDNEEYDIRVEAADNVKNRVDAFRRLEVNVNDSTNINLAQVAKVYEGRGYTRIERKNLKRLIKVQADIDNRPLQAVVQDITKCLKDVKLPAGYEVNFGGDEEERVEAFRNLSIALIASVLLVYMIMASQFESLAYPFIIMFTIPLSIIGVILFLRLYGFAFSITAMIGVIMLAGIAVNNGIILIDNIIERRRASDISREQAALESGVVRIRPILMTVLTTILGMLPLSFGIGAGADFYQPLAITVIGGFLISTILTLTYVPVVYVIVDGIVSSVTNVLRRFI
ncbi:MAG TPA: efflux RND transporter permease subunit [Candidatus Ozemobacteraceae bacterium]|nr:efflux RND transporter permease subunit [Candidatus Ozemobacteraceae bacterium]